MVMRSGRIGSEFGHLVILVGAGGDWGRGRGRRVIFETGNDGGWRRILSVWDMVVILGGLVKCNWGRGGDGESDGVGDGKGRWRGVMVTETQTETESGVIISSGHPDMQRCLMTAQESECDASWHGEMTMGSRLRQGESFDSAPQSVASIPLNPKSTYCYEPHMAPMLHEAMGTRGDNIADPVEGWGRDHGPLLPSYWKQSPDSLFPLASEKRLS